MTDEELISTLWSGEVTLSTVAAAAVRIKELNARIDELERALKAIAAEASVPVYTWKNGINFKKMYEGWRKTATSRIDIARATIGEIKGETK